MLTAKNGECERQTYFNGYKYSSTLALPRESFVDIVIVVNSKRCCNVCRCRRGGTYKQAIAIKFITLRRALYLLGMCTLLGVH